MLQMCKGYQISFADKLETGFELVNENMIMANVNVDEIESVIQHFIVMHEEPIFFILELPADLDDERPVSPGILETTHKNVYYIDGCSQEEALTIMIRVGELLIQDGLVRFGFGCHESQDELMVDKYNVITIWSQNIDDYDDFFEPHDIPKVQELKSVWDYFSEENPGICNRYDVDGKCIYDIPELFKDWGIYLAEQREEEEQK